MINISLNLLSMNFLVVDLNGTSCVYTHYLASGIKGDEDEVKILGKKKPEFLDVFDKLNPYLGFNTRFKLFNYVLNWAWLLFNYKKFDVVVVQWMQLLRYTSIEVLLLKYLQSNVKVIYVLHNIYPHNTKNSKILKRYNYLYKTLKNIAVHTDKVKNIIQKLNPNANVLRIEHGLFFEEFRQKSSQINQKKCLIVGYITKYKGVEDALHVLKFLKEKKIHLNLDIVGLCDSEYLKFLNEMINEFNLNDQVSILSEEVSTNFLIQKINQSTMLWLPYKKISQSGVSYTSIGLGKPFVGYDVGNFKDSFGDRGVAKIVEKNNIEAFSEAVTDILENENFYKKNIQNFSSQNLWDSNKIYLT